MAIVMEDAPGEVCKLPDCVNCAFRNALRVDMNKALASGVSPDVVVQNLLNAAAALAQAVYGKQVIVQLMNLPQPATSSMH